MKHSAISFLILTVVIAFSILSGCAHQPNPDAYTRDGKAYGQNLF